MPASVLLDAETIRQTVRRLGAEVEADHPDGVLLVGVLKGALILVADLSRDPTTSRRRSSGSTA